MRYIFVLFVIIAFSSCKRCKTCYVDTIDDEGKSTYSMGELCDEELEFYDGKPCVVVYGSCEFRCE